MLHQNLFLGVVVLLLTTLSYTKCCSSCSGKTNPSANSLDQQLQQVYYPSSMQSQQIPTAQVVQYASQIPPSQSQPQQQQQQQQQQPLSSSVSSLNKPPASKSNAQPPSTPSGGKIPVNLVPDVLIFELLLTSPLWSSLSSSLRGCILNKLETEAQSSLRYLITEGEGSILQQLASSAAAPPTPIASQSPSAALSPSYGYQIAGQQSPSSYVMAMDQPIVSSQSYVAPSGPQTIQSGYGTINQGSSVYPPSSSNAGYQQTNAVYQR